MNLLGFAFGAGERILLFFFSVFCVGIIPTSTLLYSYCIIFIQTVLLRDGTAQSTAVVVLTNTHY